VDFLKTEPQADICLEKYRENLLPGVFLMPVFINWRGRLPEGNVMSSDLLSVGLKKEIRKALRYAAREKISCSLENPLSLAVFEKFAGFYARVMAEKGYDALLKTEYYQRHKPEDLFLFSLQDSFGRVLGGMLVDRLFSSKLSTHFKAALNDKSGYNDLLLEEALYGLAGRLGISTLYYGKDFNLRGLDSKKPSLFFYKLRWGYRPFISWNLPTAYIDLNFLRDRQFPYVFFVSVENRPEIRKQNDYRPVLNFVLGHSRLEDLFLMLNYLEKAGIFGVKVFDRDWREIYSK
jgi:hypothetical protein